MNHVRKVFVVSIFIAFFAVSSPAFAQTYVAPPFYPIISDTKNAAVVVSTSPYRYRGPIYTYPDYDPSYPPNSNYYTTYPQDNLGYTGGHDFFGRPICYWKGYGPSRCDFNPHQWLYDPYAGEWY